jgi:hypothetical protein
MPDLWPDDFGPTNVTPPLALLREQADMLSRKTQGRLKGNVAATQNNGNAIYNFYVTAPTLGPYTYRLLSIEHPMQLYPLTIYSEPAEQKWTCANEEQFVSTLRTVLADVPTKNVINSILAQIEAVKS